MSAKTAQDSEWKQAYFVELTPQFELNRSIELPSLADGRVVNIVEECEGVLTVLLEVLQHQFTLFDGCVVGLYHQLKRVV